MPTVIEIDAPRREAKEEGFTIRFRGEDYLLPVELPADALAPFLARELDLVGVMKAIIGARADADETGEEVVNALLTRPNLPNGLVEAVRASLECLFTAVDKPAKGKPTQWNRFLAGHPSIPEYGRLVKGLVTTYGVGLGDLFASLGLSSSGGATSKPTSPGSTGSTPATSGVTRLTATS